jgi:hypothetical protein
MIFWCSSHSTHNKTLYGLVFAYILSMMQHIAIRSLTCCRFAKLDMALREGKRPTIPDIFATEHEEYVFVMKACWATETWTRPSFKDVLDALRRVPSATLPPPAREVAALHATWPRDAPDPREWQFRSVGPITTIANAAYMPNGPRSPIYEGDAQL